MNPSKESEPRRRTIDALAEMGSGTKRELHDVTGMSLGSLRNILSRGKNAGIFKIVGWRKDPSHGGDVAIWAIKDADPERPPRPEQKLTPIIGAQTIRDWQQSQDERINTFDAEDVGRFDVVRTNAYGFTVITPCYSRSWARLEQWFGGGEIVAVD